MIKESGPFKVFLSQNKSNKNIILMINDPVEIFDHQEINISTSWIFPHVINKYPDYQITFLSLLNTKKNTEKIQNFYLKTGKKYNFISLTSEGYCKYNDEKNNLLLRIKSGKEKGIDSISSNQNTILKEYYKVFQLLDIEEFQDILYVDDLNMILNQGKIIDIPEKFQGKISNDSSFFDYVGNDQEIIDYLKKERNGISDKIFYSKEFSPFAFSCYNKWYAFTFIRYALEKPKKFLHHSLFQYDVNTYTPFFQDYNLNHTVYGNVPDKRGTRYYQFLPIQELHHLVYGRKWAKRNHIHIPKFENKKNILEFHGKVYNHKRYGMKRLGYYEKYFQEVSDKLGDKFHMYFKLPKEESDSESYHQIINNPYCLGNFHFSKKYQTLNKYKFTLCTVPHSFHDSISYRLAQAVALEQLPFIENGYDPENLLNIDPKIKKLLTFNDSKDIIRLFNYYSNNLSEGKELLQYFRKWCINRLNTYKNISYEKN